MAKNDNGEATTSNLGMSVFAVVAGGVSDIAAIFAFPAFCSMLHPAAIAIVKMANKAKA